MVALPVHLSVASTLASPRSAANGQCLGATPVGHSDFARRPIPDDLDWSNCLDCEGEFDLDEIRRLATPRWGVKIESDEHRLGRWIFLRRLREALRRLSRQEEATDIGNPLAAILALLVWQSRMDRAAHFEVFADEERLTYTIAGDQYEMVAAPRFVQQELCWILCKLARVREPGRTGQILLGQHEPVPILEVTRLDSEPHRRVRISFPAPSTHALRGAARS